MYNRSKYYDLEGTVIGKYKLLQFINPDKPITTSSDIKYKVECTKCGWIGIITYKSILRTKKLKNIKCTHQYGYTIKPGDIYGKYTVIQKVPAKLCNNGLLVPYFQCKCNKCGNIVSVAASTLYATKGRIPSSSIKCKHEQIERNK